MTPEKRKQLAAACAAKKPVKPRRHIPRLPDGAAFEATYHENGEYWNGVLKVQGQVFMGRCKGVFGLMSKLDECFRRSLRCEK